MSILIKGMTIPKSCWDCPLGDSLHCQVLPSVPALWAEYTNAVREKRRHSDCPLIPVPPHGDLIDREWLIDIALHLMNTAKNDNIANGVKWLWRYIISAPAIIEAEGDDGEDEL